MSPALACPRPSAADIDSRSPEGWNRRAAVSVLQASGLRSDVTVFRLNTAAGCQSCSETALRRNTTERVYRVEAAHNPEVAGSNPAPATGKAPETGPFAYWSCRSHCSPSRARFSFALCPCAVSVVPLLLISEQLHRVRIDVLGNHVAGGVADRNRAGVVHSAPDPGVVPIGASLRDAGIGLTGLA